MAAWIRHSYNWTSSAYANAVLSTSGLIGYWRLGEASGTVAEDATANNGDGTTNGATVGTASLLASDTANTAYSFDGVDDYIEVPYAAGLNTASFSVEVWARVDGGAGTYRAVTSNRDGSTFKGWILYAAFDNAWQFWVGDGVGWIMVVGPAVSGGVQHVVATYDGSTMRLKVNNGTAATLATSAGLAQSARPLRIGAGANEGAASFFFNGVIDEVAVYDTVLSDATIADHYTAGTGSTPLAATITGTSTVTASPTAAATLAAPLVGTNTTTAAIISRQTLTAAITGTSTVTAAAALRVTLTSALNGSTTLSASLSASDPLATAVAGTSVLAGALSESDALATAITGSSAVTANLTTGSQLGLAATITGASTVTAEATPSSLVALAAAISGSSTVTASVAATQTLATAMTGTSTVTSDLTATAPGGLSTAITGTSTLTAATTERATLAALMNGTSVLAGALTETALLTVSIFGLSSVTGQIVEVLPITNVIIFAASDQPLAYAASANPSTYAAADTVGPYSAPDRPSTYTATDPTSTYDGGTQ